ncbi:SDR family oxidoreductase [Nocardia sp. CDC159]|uniref:SDR family oxidoreductase n=1 Tax=Nocardia pulmonis TaxID=2951408 RepID=A0A9X2EDQ1_9NOCA|nr:MULTISPECIES: SDR family oxidoreductase [Nocardia]MCM6779022.1 SDR family oxidoreductase [Nocardia pulmonis]MCM6791912.1 SDR family oxidoreductase [Nocardia sp. CDC159]
MTTATRTALLTGVSGVVGRAVAAELRGFHVIGLAHSATDVPEADEVLHADLRSPRLGLPDRVWHGLAERVDVVIHSGATTNWGQAREIYQGINIDGTARVVELALAAGAPIHLISSCFVHALERGSIDDLRPGNVVTPYIWSKLESERLVAESGVPHTIHRPTNVIGDSATGASSRPQIVQQLSEWFCRGKAPYFPLHPGNLMDFVPLDVVAHGIARAVEANELGRMFWQTYGAEAMTVDEAQQIMLDHAADLGRRISAVPVVNPTVPLPIPLERIAPMSRTFLQVLIDTSEVTHACGGVLPTSLPELRERFGVPTVSDRDAYRRTLKYWAGDPPMAESDRKETA